jgi:hypothetical protein
MFKLFSKLMMLLLVMALAGPFILKRPNGEPMMKLADLQLPSFSMPASVGELWQRISGGNDAAPAPTSTVPVPVSGNEASIQWSKPGAMNSSFVPTPGVQYQKQEGVFFRYKDSNGIWQFSDTPQPGVTNYVSNIDPKANVIQSLSQEKIDNALGRTPPPAPEATGKEEKKDDSLLSKLPLPTTVPVTEIPNLIQQAKDVQTLVNQRTQQLEQQGRN